MLSAPAATAPPAPGRRPRQPVDGVRASGHEVVSTEVGTPQPLPPELEVVAFRVLQEMLTNAIKHGRRDAAGPGRAALGGRAADRGPQRDRHQCRRDPAARGRPAPSAGVRASTACGAGSRRSAAASTYAVAPRPAARRSRRPPGSRCRSPMSDDPGAAGRRPGPVPRGRAGDRRRPGRHGGRRRGGDGLEAVRLVDELAPDVVLMDIRMPEMDGVEATRQIFLPERVVAAHDAGAGRRADHLQPRRPGRDRDPVRRQRLPAQGHHAGDARATRSAPCTPATPCSRPQDLSTLLDGQFRAPDAHARRRTSR